MAEYCLEWSIELDADTPEEAARKAREIQLDPTSTATHFRVIPSESGEDVVEIDVAE